MLTKDPELIHALSLAKTLTMPEVLFLAEYLEKKRPKRILEFGTQYGCSAFAFKKISDRFDLGIEVHSWDIHDQRKPELKDAFTFHNEAFDYLFRIEKDDVLFLDAHDFNLTRNLMLHCLEGKNDFMCHDMSSDSFDIRRREWELPLLGELIHPAVWTEDHYENKDLTVDKLVDKFGVAIVRHK